MKLPEKLALGIIIIFSNLFFSEVTHAQINLPSNSSVLESQLKALAKAAILTINNVKINGDLASSASKYGLPEKYFSKLRERIDRYKVAHDYLDSIHDGYSNFNSNIIIKNVKINSATSVTVNAEESTELIPTNADNIRAGIYPKYTKQHQFTLALVNGQLQLTESLLNDPEEPDADKIKNAVSAPVDAVPASVNFPVSKNDYLRVVKIANSSQSNYLHANQIQALGLFSGLVNSLPVQISQRITLNRQGELNYMNQWWGGFNPSYRDLTPNGGDCTSYASQVLSEGGGLPSVGGLWNDDHAWWYNPAMSSAPFNQTHSWGGAVNFYSHLKLNPSRATQVTNLSYLYLGDVVQVDFGRGEKLSHTMIVSWKRESDGAIFLSGHTIPHLYYAVSDIFATFKPDSNRGWTTPKIYAWHLADTY